MFMIKNRHDARYQKTEAAIFSAILGAVTKNPQTIYLSPYRLAHLSKISPSTLYRHYKNVDEILHRHQRQTLRAYRIMLNRLLKKPLTLKQILRHVLIFISLRPRFFKVIFRQSDRVFVKKLFAELKPKFCSACHLPKNSKTILDLYFNEFYGVLENWSEVGFAKSDIESILDNLIVLATTARPRLHNVS